MAILDVTRAVRFRGALKITLDDVSGQESFTVETPGGQKLVLRDGPGEIQIADTNGNSVSFDGSGITVNAASKVTVNASIVEINAGAINLNAGHYEVFRTHSV